MDCKNKKESTKNIDKDMNRSKRVIISIKRLRDGVVLGEKLNIKKLINEGRK